jgi:hypothetical protein
MSHQFYENLFLEQTFLNDEEKLVARVVASFCLLGDPAFLMNVFKFFVSIFSNMFSFSLSVEL